MVVVEGGGGVPEHSLWVPLCDGVGPPSVPLAEAHGPNGEAEVVGEVVSSHHRHVPEGEQLEVLKLQHRLPGAARTLLPGLTDGTEGAHYGQ